MLATCFCTEILYSEPSRPDSPNILYQRSVTRRSAWTKRPSISSVWNNPWSETSRSRPKLLRARVSTAVPDPSDTPRSGSVVRATSNVRIPFPFTGLLSASTTVGGVLQSLGKVVWDDVKVISRRLRDLSTDLCRRLEIEMKSFERGVTAKIILPENSAASSTLEIGHPDSVGTVKPRPLAV